MPNHWSTLFVCALALTPLARAQSGFQKEYLDEWENPSTQVIQLAEAVPAEKYCWRPGPGVRSVSEVYIHIALSNFLMPDMIGGQAPSELYSSLPRVEHRSMAMMEKNKQLEKSITDKRKAIDLLKRSFAGVRDNFSKADEAKLNQPVDFFGAKTTVRGIFLRILAHNNEHMGQSVAYARVNGIVPPWSK